MQPSTMTAEKAPIRAGAALRAYRSVVRSFGRDGPLVVACAALTTLGVLLRVRDLGFPPVLTWDEHHFVLNARNYIERVHDWNDHPPLGKLLIVFGMLVYGDTPVGWRVVPMAFGIASVLLARAIAVRIFRDRRAGLIAAAFVAGDGFLIAYSRTALLDGMLGTLTLAVLFASIRARSYRGIAAAALLVGSAANIKMSGAFLILPLTVVCALRRDWFRSSLSLGLAPLAYVVLFMAGLAQSREPHGIMDALRATNAIVVHHAGLTSFTHPLTSHWYTWFLPTRPITMRYDVVRPGVVRAMSCLGNPLLWWACDLAFVAGLSALFYAGARLVRERRRRFHLGRTVRANALLTGYAVTMMLPWVFGNRDSYIYHYLPTYACLLILTAGDVSVLYRRKRLVALVFVLAVALVSVYYAPVWGQVPLSSVGFRSRLFLRTWQ